MELNFSLAWIRQRRKALGLTYKEMAHQVGCAVVTLKKIETGERKPSQAMAERLAECLQIDAARRSAFIAQIRGLKAEVDIPHSPIAPSYVPLIGREAELAHLKQKLIDPLCRLLTLLGPGGIGKTRLAQAVLESFLKEEQVSFYDGIFFVDMANLPSENYIISAIADALSFELDTSGKDPRPQIGQLCDFIGARKMLLILDNFEQLLAGADLIGNLLRNTSHLRFLVTSRERLGLGEECLFPLAGLRYPGESVPFSPDLEDLSAIRLFLTYGRRLLPDLQISEQNWRTLVHLARLTEGSPLALELAAAWVDALPLADIARELEAGLTILARRGADPMARHASMESIFAASLKRLGEADSAVFCKLCVFRGGFTRPAAQAVAGAHLPALLVFIQKSLVRLDQRTGKYYIHELLRQFGVEILKTSGELDVIAQAQFRYFVDRTISLENKLHGPEQADGLGQFDKDQDNLRLALQWGIDHPEAADALVDMVNALTWYWRMRSSVAEACDWLDKINARVHPSPVHQARLHWVSGHHAWMRGAFAQARDHQQAGITLCESLGLGQSVEMGKLMVGLGMTDAEDNRPEEARQSFERALELFRALGDDWWTAFTLGWLALPLHHSNSKQQAHRSISECIQIYRGLGDQWALGLNLDHFATMEYADRRFSQAEELAKEAMIYEDSTGHKHSVGQILLLLGRIAQQREDFARAREYYRQSLEIFLQMGHPYFTQEARQLLSELLE